MRVVNLGGGRRLFIKQVHPDDMLTLMNGEKDVAACWDHENNTIYIDKKMSSKRKWESYWHELQHAIVDISTIDKGGI